MKTLAATLLVFVAMCAHAHVHQWEFVGSYIGESGDQICVWSCTVSGQDHTIQTVGCWNPND